ncbi:MAG: helix-hairpin-helix domain-containing protein [Desulfobacterales bacterium]|jgi:competence protein ComEA|nr:helix-hairpin-helix domain-containing protein [Desulfobacteraceae bacterium]MBT4364104.1 helix-hairpin-helix domain-containing protein [Desulfobacteraceae bacterium]MBT7086094.1 helix-hairpin-helix domain-containing protein [Desulfobacterales bacterium]MBT7697190.1 helix-hairpin-helix domain-containing protein [Desulfobacterales bacterium]
MSYKRKFTLLTAVLMFFVIAGISRANEANEKININTASIEELTRLKRIGTKYAERIIKYRTEVGVFKNPEDIMKVKGIGSKVWELNQEMITVKLPDKK